jgi:hypothetical protein
MDGGAMTCTTDRLDLLWNIEWIRVGQHLATLKVANNLSDDPIIGKHMNGAACDAASGSNAAAPTPGASHVDSGWLGRMYCLAPKLCRALVAILQERGFRLLSSVDNTLFPPVGTHAALDSPASLLLEKHQVLLKRLCLSRP